MTRKGEQTREHILTQAGMLMKSKGFAATTINELLKISGKTKGNLYFHFADKQAVGLAVLKREQQLFNDFLEWSFACPDPVEGLKNHFKGVLDKNCREDFVGAFCLAIWLLKRVTAYLPFPLLWMRSSMSGKRAWREL